MHEYSHPSRIDPPNIVHGECGKFSTIAPHYFVVHASNNPHGHPVATIQFQDGPLGEDHIDGVHNEDLIVMVLARLLAFQQTQFACRENALAITKLEEALHWLSQRTQERRGRQVEGKHEI